MKIFIREKFILLLFLFCLAGYKGFSLRIDSTVVEKHSFSESEWKRITKDIDYSKEKSPAISKSSSYNLPVSSGAAKIILFVLVSALLILLLLRVFAGNIFLANKKIDDEDFTTELQSEDDIHLTDLEKAYNDAIAAGNFRLAIRISYLMTIRELSEQQLIKWKKEKTNREYIFEMMNNAAISHFREITNLFERIWYGEAELNETVFRVINPRFSSFIAEIKNQKGTASY